MPRKAKTKIRWMVEKFGAISWLFGVGVWGFGVGVGGESSAGFVLLRGPCVECPTLGGSMLGPRV